MNDETSKTDDRALIRRVLDGDRASYAPLVRRHEARIRGFCALLLFSREEGEDAAQEVFVKAFGALGKFRGDASFSTWIHHIALNHCRGLRRQWARRRTDSWDARAERGEDAVSVADDRAAARRDNIDLARRLLADLPEEYRTALMLREGQGMSYEDIARVMGTTLDSVKARLRRAREALQEKARHFLTPADV